jgi:hypothetical protein
MNARRPFAVAGAAALLFGGAATLGAGPLHLLHAYALLCPQPSLNAVGADWGPSSQHASLGGTVVITGSNFDSQSYLGCSTNLDVAIGGTHFSVDTRNGSGSRQTFFLTQPASGPVVVTNGDGKSAGGNLVFVTDPAAGSLPATPRVGDAMSATGSRFDLGGQLTGASVAWQTNAGSCPSSSATVAGGGGSVSIPALQSYCNGTATLTLSWSGGHSLSVGLGKVDVAPTWNNATPAEVPAGGAVTVHGSGLGNGGSAKVGGVSAQSAWSDTAVTVTVPDNAGGGAVNLTRADGYSIGAGNLTEDARIDSVSPASAAPGTSVTVTGGGFGASTGSVSVGSTEVTPTSWSPTSVSFQVPQGVQSGGVAIKPASGGAALGSLSISGVPGGAGPDPGAVSSPGGPGATTGPGGVSPGGGGAATAALGGQPGSPVSASSSSSSSSGSHTAPTFIAPSADGPIVSTTPVQLQKPPAPAGPVSLTLATSSEAGDPGQSVPLNVSLVAFGKPVSGAKVDFLIVVEPGRDASVDPPQTVTDEAGHATATLHLSSTAGDHIVLARSGQYSDEVRVSTASAGAGPVAALAGAGRGTDVVATVASGPPKMLIVGGLIACLFLFVGGFVIQVVVPRSRPAGAVAAAGVGAVAPRADRWRALTPFELADRFTTLVQFACTVAFVVAVLPPARLVQRFARRG